MLTLENVCDRLILCVIMLAIIYTGMCDIRLLCPIRFATCEHLDSFARGATDGHIGNETSDTGQLYPNTQLWQEHGLNVP